MFRGGWGRGRSGSTPQFQPERSYSDPGSLTAMAESNGWPVAPDLPTMADGTPIDLAGGPFAPGRWRALAPVVVGRAGYWPFVAATVIATTRAGLDATYAVTALAIPGSLPYVHCYPESWRAKVSDVVPEVDLEYGEFNDLFATFATDRRTAYAVLTPRTMQALLAAPPLDELWTVGPHLCLARIDGHAATVLDAHLRVLTVCAGDLSSGAWQPPGPPPA